MFIFTSKFNREQLFTAAGQSVTVRNCPTGGRGMGYPMLRTRARGGFPDARWCHVFTKSTGYRFIPAGRTDNYDLRRAGAATSRLRSNFPLCEQNNRKIQGNGNIGLSPTLFHKIRIFRPIQPIRSADRKNVFPKQDIRLQKPITYI